MMLNKIIDHLTLSAKTLNQGITLIWRYSGHPGPNPLKATPGLAWPEFPDHPSDLKDKQPKWLYAEAIFPEKYNGISCNDANAHLFIFFWMPLTLWIDGVMQFREKHVWMATGPIFHPFPTPIIPGKPYRFIMCIEPTAIPKNMEITHSFEVKLQRCMEMAVILDAAASELRLAETLAKSPGEKQMVMEAAGLIDLQSVKSQKWDRVLLSIQDMEEHLAPLSDRAKAITVHLIGNTHIDMDWMWTWKDTIYCIRRDFKSVTDMQDDYAELTFTHSQIPTYEVVKSYDPAVFAKVKRRIREGRWENAAATWVEGDLNMADGESLVRQIVYANHWSKRYLQSSARVFWAPDTYGHPGNMPQIARLGECNCYFHMRGNPGHFNNIPVRLWTGLDGTTIWTFSTTGYSRNLQPREIINATLENHKFGLKQVLYLWGIGDHGGGLPRYELYLLSLFRNKPLIPSIRFSTIKTLLNALRRENPRLPTSVGETFTSFEGGFTTHADAKRYNRECESALLRAEAFSAMAGLDSNKSLGKAWRAMLFNQFHDLFAGSAVHESYRNVQKRAGFCLDIARQTSQKALNKLVKPVSHGRTLILFNPLGFNITEPVAVSLPKTAKCLEDHEGNIVPIQPVDGRFLFIARNVPAFSRKAYRILREFPSGFSPPEIKVRHDTDLYTIETSQAVIRILKGSGIIGSFYDKAIKREWIGYCIPKPMTSPKVTRSDLGFNVFQLIDESPTIMSAWLLGAPKHETLLLNDAVVKLAYIGPVSVVFRVRHQIRMSKIIEDIVIYHDYPRIDFKARINWKEKGCSKTGIPQLKVSFTASLRRPFTRFEGPFSIVERLADSVEQPSQKWADISGADCGFAILNDCKYCYDALGGRLRLTLLRNAYSPDAETDTGHHAMRFGFLPHKAKCSNSELTRAGMAFNRPVEAVITNKPLKAYHPYLVVEGSDTVVCTCLRRAEYSPDLLIRLFNTSHKPSSLRLILGEKIARVQEVNFLENPIGAKVHLKQGWISTKFRPFEIKTLLVTINKM